MNLGIYCLWRTDCAFVVEPRSSETTTKIYFIATHRVKSDPESHPPDPELTGMIFIKASTPWIWPP
jgi:hypothetical protein